MEAGANGDRYSVGVFTKRECSQNCVRFVNTHQAKRSSGYEVPESGRFAPHPMPGKSCTAASLPEGVTGGLHIKASLQTCIQERTQVVRQLCIDYQQVY